MRVVAVRPKETSITDSTGVNSALSIFTSSSCSMSPGQVAWGLFIRLAQVRVPKSPVIKQRVSFCSIVTVGDSSVEANARHANQSFIIFSAVSL